MDFNLTDTFGVLKRRIQGSFKRNSKFNRYIWSIETLDNQSVVQFVLKYLTDTFGVLKHISSC